MLVLAAGLCSPALAQVRRVPNAFQNRPASPGSYTSRPDGGYSYRQNGYSRTTYGDGSSRTTYGGVTTTTGKNGTTKTTINTNTGSAYPGSSK